jgi:aminopeptidase N
MRAHKAYLFACAVLAACSRAPSCASSRAPSHAETVHEAVTASGCPRAATIAVLDHQAELTIALTPPALAGHGEVRVQALAAAQSVELDSPGLHISSAASRGQQLPFKQDGDHTCFDLPQPIAAGEELTLELAWTADPHTQGLTFAEDQAWAGYRASAWLPTKQDPGQRATTKLSFHVPEDLVFVASRTDVTTVAHSLSDRDRPFLEAFQEIKTPTPPFLYAFALGRFGTAHYYGQGFSLSAVGPPDADLMGVLELTLSMFEFLRDRTGSWPAVHHYTQVFVHGEAAQEALGMALISEHALRDVKADPTDDWVFAHELAHQWFGVLIPCADFADFWLNEGFATFMTGAIKEHRWGRAAYETELSNWRARSQKVHDTGRDAPVALSRPGSTSAPPTEAQLQARGVTYFRGALVLDKLRRELGDTKFWEGIKQYVKNQAGKPTRTADLQSALTSVSGKNQTPFFDRWIYTTARDL